MKYINPLLATDFYKTGHIKQYPVGTELVYSNFTPRSDKLAPKSEAYDGKTVFFGLQGFIQWFLVEAFNKDFFIWPEHLAVDIYKHEMDCALGVDVVDVEHIRALHKLGYLPIEIKALPEGIAVAMKVPYFTVQNTLPEFYWLTNYLETVMSTELWKPITVASIARQYRMLLEKYAEKTGSPKDFVMWQGHDFSARGMSGIHDVAGSGAGHLLSFFGTDSISAIDYLKMEYNAEGFVGGSVPASEHSVACMNIAEIEAALIEKGEWNGLTIQDLT